MTHPIYSNLERFIRKYYTNQLLRGTLLFLAIGFGIAVLLFLVAGLNDFGKGLRTVLFYALVIAEAVILFRLIAVPIFGIVGLKRGLTAKQAATIVGAHFPEVGDKLLNFMELDAVSDKNPVMVAAINQKIAGLRVVPFDGAVDHKRALRYARFLVPVFFGFFALWAFGQLPVLRAGGQRLVNHQTEFLPVAPFEVAVRGLELPHLAGEDLNIEVELRGLSIPEEVVLIVGNSRLMTVGSSAYNFNHTFRNIDNGFSFYIEAAGFSFGPYEVAVVHPPLLKDFLISVKPPLYTGVLNFTIDQFTDVVFPEGSKLEFYGQTKTVGSLFIKRATDSLFFQTIDNSFLWEGRVKESFQGQLVGSNAVMSKVFSGQQFFQVVKDAYPNIEARFVMDSLRLNTVVVEGFIQDDYGFSKLQIVVEDMQGNKLVSQPLSVPGKVSKHSFYNELRFDDVGMKGGQQYKIYVLVSDNDGVNGPKSTKSSIFLVGVMDKEARIKQQIGMSGKTAESVREQIEQLQKTQKQLAKSKDQIKDRKQKRFETDKNTQELLAQQQELLEKLAEIEAQRKEQRAVEEEAEMFSEQLLEKQRKIDALLAELADEDMKRLMEEIHKLMQELNNDALKDKLEQLQMENKHLMNQMDRYLQLLEQLQFEKSLEQSIEKLNDLIEKQDALLQDPKTDLAQQEAQAALERETLDALEDIKDLADQDADLKDPNGFDGPEEEVEQAAEDMNQSQEGMKKKDSEQSKSKQAAAKGKLQKAKESLMDFQSQMASEQNAENMKDLRQILQNLLALSFDQEQLLNTMREQGKNSPRYPEFMREQRMLQGNSQIVADSLNALGKRVPEISAFVGKELLSIDKSLTRSLAYFAERELGKGNGEQQFVMTSTNNLANLLQQALEQMQKEQAAMMDGSQNCQKPGKGKGSMDSLKKMQQELAEKLGKMKGNQEGPPQPGSKPGMGQMSKEVVEMMAKQEQIRKALEGMEQKEGKEGKQGNKGMQQAIEEMKKNEDDIANKRFNKEFFERQQEILTRLLEVEEADLQRKEDEQRIVETAKNTGSSSGSAITLYLQQKAAQVEELRFQQVRFGSFYTIKNQLMQQ